MKNFFLRNLVILNCLALIKSEIRCDFKKNHPPSSRISKNQTKTGISKALYSYTFKLFEKSDIFLTLLSLATQKKAQTNEKQLFTIQNFLFGILNKIELKLLTLSLKIFL